MADIAMMAAVLMAGWHDRTPEDAVACALAIAAAAEPQPVVEPVPEPIPQPVQADAAEADHA